MRDAIRFSLDGQEIDAYGDESIWQAAKRHGVDIPHLCHREGLRPDGNCRACVVEVEGERVLAASCCRQPQPGMVVTSASERARTAQRGVLELLAADQPARESRANEFDHWCRVLGVSSSRYPAQAAPVADSSHPAIKVSLDACILCTRCVRACREVQGNDVIGLAGHGFGAHIVFDDEQALGDSSCVACGECVQVCPTDALTPAKAVLSDERITSVCPYCGVGCLVELQISDGRLVGVEGANGPANAGRLCVKGRFGFDYIHSAERLTQPLVRKEGVGKSPDQCNTGDWRELFREASWEEALDVAAGGLRTILDTHGRDALAAFGSAKGSNEEAYLLQKLVRIGFGSNHVDHCTRLCHASSVTALLEMVGSGAVSNPVADVALADVIVVIGSNTTANHPVAATWMKNAVERGARLVVMDPRRPDLARDATHYLPFRPDTDVALINAIMQAVIEGGWVDQAFIESRTNGYAELREHLAKFTPEEMAPVCGIEAATIREVARLYATSEQAMIFWGMGVSQHVHGTDNARALIALALITGQIGRPGTGLHPLRGQNNVQGASDMGLIPMVLPGYRSVSDNAARDDFETLWGAVLDERPGLTVVEIMHAILDGQMRGMYMVGENPAMSDPNLAHARKALASLDHLVVQDIFLTETAALADVVLPATACAEKDGTFTNTDRRVQLGRKAVNPPGEARADLWIIQEMARRLGLAWDYADHWAVYDEMRQAFPTMAGITRARLEQSHSVIYPCETEADVGDAVIFTDTFPTVDGRAKLTPAQFSHADELPDDEYPLVLITGRLLEHWHTGAMTRRASVLDAIEPQAEVSMHPDDIATAGLVAGERVQVATRRGAIEPVVQPDRALQRGQIFMPFCFREAAANLLTNEALDPAAKIPEFKFCAAKVARLEP
jgi:formate dehydrogenase major subunit